MSSYKLQNFKGDVTLAYQFNKAVSLFYTYRIANTNTIYQRTNRFRLDDYLTGQHSIMFKTGSLQFRAYVNKENTGDSYNIRSMAENIDRNFKSDNVWYADFTNQFNTTMNNGAAVQEAMEEARRYADQTRPQPNTPQTVALIDKLRDINDWNIGAALRVKTSMYHSELQHNLTDDLLKSFNALYKLSLMYELDFREYIVVPDGNYFINPIKTGANLIYWKMGGFLQASKYLFQQKLKVNGVVRIDKNQYFSPQA